MVAEQLALGHHLAGVGGQVGQQLELLGAQVERFAGQVHLVGRLVHHQLAHRHRRPASAPPPARRSTARMRASSWSAE